MQEGTMGREINGSSKKNKKHDVHRIAEGTKPGIDTSKFEDPQAWEELDNDESDFSENEVTKIYKKPDSSLAKDIAGVMEGLNKAGRMSAAEKAEKKQAKASKEAEQKKAAAKEKVRAAAEAEKEEREWQAGLAMAREKVKLEGEIPPTKAENKSKPFGLKEKAALDAKVAGEDDAVWEGKEWKARKGAAEEDVEWEDREWAAKMQAAEAKVKEDEEAAKVKGLWATLREKLGLGKKKEKK